MHFGRMRFRVAAITSLVGIVLTIGAVKEFDDHNDASAWLLVIVVVECVLVTQNALRRYMQFTEDEFLTHGYQGGIVPRTRYRAFKDIQAIVVVPGPRASSNVLTIRVDMKNGTKRMIMAVSALRKSSPSDSAAARFEELVKRLRDSVEAAAA